MGFSDRITIAYNRLVTNLSFHFVFWLVALLFYLFLMGSENIFSAYKPIIEINSDYLLITFLSLFTALLFSIIDAFFNEWFLRIFSIGLMVLIKWALYFASGFLVLTVAAIPSANRIESGQYITYLIELPANDLVLMRFLVFFWLAAFLNTVFKGLRKKVGPGNFKRWLFGFMNKPREEERIFMFIDLKGSTTAAEKLGHRKFSRLCQDVFNDMAIMDNYYGEIYQYLGDGAIVSWKVSSGLKNLRFLHAFFAYTRVIHSRRHYYNRKYGFIPQFKAGIHVGKVMVLQVGKIRRDISYNGDTMNTAARIESKCNELHQNLLISAQVFQILPDKKAFRFKNVGEIPLRGKRKAVEIYGVHQKTK